MSHTGYLPLLTTRRYRRMLVAGLVTLLTSATLLGLISFMRWRGRQALQYDTRAVIAQVGQQLVRTLQSRRGTLTFLRDTLNRRPDLTSPQLQAMATSAVEHTRYLVGTGLVRTGQKSATWWSGPRGLSQSEITQLHRAIANQIQLRDVWRVPSTLVTTPTTKHPLLVMLEPLRAASYRQSAVVGVFDLKPLVADFFAATPAASYPVQLLDGDTTLYRARSWQYDTEDPPPILEEYALKVDAVRWTVQMQPASTPIAQTLSWSHLLLIGLSVIAGLGVITIVWILAARTWILQRAVARRTAALRRTSSRLRQLATTDELTGLYNRRFFLNRWEWECARAKRYQRPLACLMIDVNGFKHVNDRLGHHAGDLVLKHVAQELKTLLRESDILARFGGDEFVIALPETNVEQAALVAEKLRQVSIPVTEGHGQVDPVRLSVGMSLAEAPDESPDDILQAADQSLYTSKRQGSHTSR